MKLCSLIKCIKSFERIDIYQLVAKVYENIKLEAN